MPRDVKWSWDETVLALDFYARHHPQPPGSGHPDIIALSETLNAMAAQQGIERTAKFRNPEGVYMKLMNFRRFDPEFFESGRVGLSRGAVLEEEVFGRFWTDMKGLREAADAIRAAVRSGQAAAPADEDEFSAEEGGLVLALHRRRERSPKLAAKKLAAVMKEHGRLQCEVCQFDFANVYGARGAGFLEVHHNVPLGSFIKARTIKLSDLACVCANCHRMLHRGGLFTVDELKRSLTTGHYAALLGSTAPAEGATAPSRTSILSSPTA